MIVLALQRLSPTPFDGIDNGQKLIYVFVTATPSNAVNGGYVAGGDPLDFTQLGALLEAGYAPLQGDFKSQSPAAGHSGYSYYYRPGNPASLVNGRLQVETTGNGAGNPLQELAAGAYPAAILADTIVGTLVFVRT